jgi:hypothetical protein
MPTVASSRPMGTTTFGPILGSGTLVVSCAVTISAPTIGRKARPLATGE